MPPLLVTEFVRRLCWPLTLPGGACGLAVMHTQKLASQDTGRHGRSRVAVVHACAQSCGQAGFPPALWARGEQVSVSEEVAGGPQSHGAGKSWQLMRFLTLSDEDISAYLKRGGDPPERSVERDRFNCPWNTLQNDGV